MKYRIIALFVIIFLNAVNFSLVFSQNSIIIEVKEQACVEDYSVRLKDIAVIKGVSEEIYDRLSNIEICLSPSPGVKRIIYPYLIKNRMREHNFLEENIKIIGNRCIVTLKTITISGEKIKEVALDYIKQKIKGEDIERKIEIIKVPRDVVAPGKDLSLKVIPLDYGNIKGLLSIFVGIYNGDHFYKKVPVFFKVQTFEYALVSVKNIKRFEKIKSDYVEIKKVETTGIRKDFLKDIDSAVGKRAKYSIQKNNVIFSDMIEKPPLINRGDFVDIKVIKGSVVVLCKGRAKKDGKLGEFIPVRNLVSNKDLLAKVENSKTVIIK